MNDENLKPIKPGEIRNPKGKKPGTKNIKTIIKKYLSQEIVRINPVTKLDENLTIEEHMVLAAIANSMNGEDRPREDILNRYYGKPTESVKIKGSNKPNISDEEKENLLNELTNIIKKDIGQEQTEESNDK